MRHHKGKLRAFGDYFCDWEWGFNEASLTASIRMGYSFSKYFWNVGMCSLLRSQDYIYYLYVDISIFPNEITFQHVAHALKADQSSCDNLRSAKTTHRCVLPSTGAQPRTLRGSPKTTLTLLCRELPRKLQFIIMKGSLQRNSPLLSRLCLLLVSGELERKSFETDIIQKPSAT